MHCPLCQSQSQPFSETHQRIYYRCTVCYGIFLDPSFLLSEEKEKERYQLHQNDVDDEGYQNFVSPLVDAVLNTFEADDLGLDFGSGTNSVITSLLRKKGYNIETYDPFFDPNTDALEHTYDYIVSCEVIEHFYQPSKEFARLYSLLKPGGILFCKTNLYSSSINFESWWYKNDATHVFFYSEKTVQWIKKHFDYQELKVLKAHFHLKK